MYSSQEWFSDTAGGGVDPGDPIGYSLRFRGAQQLIGPGYNGTTTTGTFSCWFKAATSDAVRMYIVGQTTQAGTTACDLYRTNSEHFPDNVINQGQAPANQFQSRGAVRDPSAWYHLVWNFTAATQTADLYINGVLHDTVFNTDNRQVSGSGAHPIIWGNNGAGTSPDYLEGYLANCYYIDGEALEPTVFGRYNANDVWVPVTPEGLTFGTNGFHLDFSDPNDIGADRSGNGNDFTPSGFDTVGPSGGPFNHNSKSFDQATMSIPTGDGKNPYWIDLVNNPNSPGGTSTEWTGNVPLGWCTGGVNDPINPNENATLFGDGSAAVPQVASLTFDLRDYPTINSVAVWTGWSAASGATTTAQISLLDADKNIIPNTTVTPVRVGNSSQRQELSGTDVGARYILFDQSSGGNASYYLYGIEVNGVVISADPASAEYDSMLDSPTQNWATLNSTIAVYNGADFERANLSAFKSTTVHNTFPCGQILTGKKYWECRALQANNDYLYFGIVPLNGIDNSQTSPAWHSGKTFYYTSDLDTTGAVRNFGLREAGNFGGLQTGDIISLAYDADTKEVTLRKNGDEATASTYTLNTEETELTPAIITALSTYEGAINLGQQPFVYTPPEGFEALQTENMPTPVIPNGRDYFQAITGPGTGGAAGGRNGTWIPDLFSAPPGDREQAHASTSDVFHSSNGSFNAFDGNTATVTETAQSEGRPGWISFRPSDTSLPALTANSSFKIRMRRIAEVWINGTQMTGDFSGEDTTYDFSSQLTFPFTLESFEIGATSSNDAGLYFIELDGEYLIQNGILEVAQQTFPNGLWWIKDRDNNSQHQLVDSVNGTSDVMQTNSPSVGNAYVPPTGTGIAWCWADSKEGGFSVTNGAHGLGKTPAMVVDRGNNFWHQSLPAGKGMILGGSDGTSDQVWTVNETTVVGPGGGTYFTWAEIPGFSAFGSYSANSSYDGPVIYTGFRPAFLLIQRFDSNSGAQWVITDSTIYPYNIEPTPWFAAWRGAAELTSGEANLDLLSNGFKIRTTASETNNTPGQYLYAAFAENPFQSPVTAR